MMRRVLAIRPTGRGFGFAVLEGPRRLLDWGVKGERLPDLPGNLAKIRRLAIRYEPDTLVIEDLAGSGHRSPRAHELAAALQRLASELNLKPRIITRRAAKRTITREHPVKQFRLARLIGEHFPRELGPRVPPHRKPWMSQDSRYAMFEAVALGLAAFRHPGQTRLDMADSESVN